MNQRILLIIILLGTYLVFCAQSQKHSRIIILPEVKIKQEQIIRPSGYGKTLDRKLTYNNLMQAETYVNGTLSSTITKNRMDIFKSYYYWDKDTLVIEGGYVLFAGYSFSAKIYKDKVKLVQLNRDDDYRLDNYVIKSEQLRHEVECSSYLVKLNSKPDKFSQERIYGYIEFEGTDHYPLMDNRPLKDRTVLRDNLKTYFRADRIGSGR